MVENSLVPKLPDSFSTRIKKQFDGDHEAILQAFDQDTTISNRYNPRKAFLPAIQAAVPWSSHAYYLEKRPNYALDPLFHAGAYYPQEASSLILEEIMNHIQQTTHPSRLLDLCAAPGGKSTHLLSLIDKDSVLLCNEIVPKRFAVLNENLIKWGHSNFISTNYRPDQIARLDAIFDVVLVDAPCSGEGLFRKQKEWRSEWHPDNCALCARRQIRILDQAIKNVRNGGYLIYSTCTLNPEENMDQIIRLTETSLFEAIEFPTIKEFGFVEQKTKKAIGYLSLPHKIKGEPFFISCLKKEGRPNYKMPEANRLKNRFSDDITAPFQIGTSFVELDGSLYLKNKNQQQLRQWLIKKGLRYFLPTLGSFKHNDLIPDHFSAMNSHVEPNHPKIEVNESEALQYLRHEKIALDVSAKGWYLLSYRDIGLGWVKFDGRRIINKYPIKWRLRS